MGAGLHLKRIRTAANKSANSFAKMIGVDVERYRKWEQKDLTPREEDAEIVKRFFGISDLEEISEIKDVPKSSNMNREVYGTTHDQEKEEITPYQQKYIALLEKSLEDKETVIQSIKAELSEFKAVFENFKKMGAENRISLEKSRRDLNTIMDRQNALIDALSLFLPPPQDHQGNFGETVDTIFVQHRSARNRTGSKSYTGKSHT